MKSTGISLLLSLALAAGHAACAQSSPTQPAPAQAPVVGLADMLPDALDFELKDINGKTVHLSDFRGKAVLLNFWATYCAPCKQEMPWLIEFQKQYGPQGLVILGVAMDDSADTVRRFAERMGVNYSVLMGTQPLADKYFVKGLPVTVYIDRAGKMTDQVAGLATRSHIENEIQLARLSQSKRVFRGGRHLSSFPGSRHGGKVQSEDQVSSLYGGFLAVCRRHVSAQHSSQERRQGPSLFQHCGEPARCCE